MPTKMPYLNKKFNILFSNLKKKNKKILESYRNNKRAVEYITNTYVHFKNIFFFKKEQKYNKILIKKKIKTRKFSNLQNISQKYEEKNRDMTFCFVFEHVKSFLASGNLSWIFAPRFRLLPHRFCCPNVSTRTKIEGSLIHKLGSVASY